MTSRLPRIGITADLPTLTDTPPTYASRCAYADMLRRCDALPIILPPPINAAPAELALLATQYLDAVDGVLFTGGADPATESFGQPTHPAAKKLNPARQCFELALFAALDQPPHQHKPVLAVCLGMQLMALHHKGSLHQHLPDSPHAPTAPEHLDNALHTINPTIADHPVLAAPGRAASVHHQAVNNPGRLRVVARAHDGVIEAIDDPARPFYLGVQWHPERTPDGPDSDHLASGLFRAFIARVKQNLPPHP